MKIYQVEELVGITKKNIRFYEDEGLLNPERDPQNGYREYSLKDVRQLETIKLLRKLSVPIEEIRLLQKGTISFSESMNTQIEMLEKQQQSAEMMKEFCIKLKNEIDDFKKLDAQKYLSEIRNLENKGSKFMDTEKEDINRKKKSGAGIAALVFCSLILLLLILFSLWINKTGKSFIPLLVAVIPTACIITGTIIELIQRFKEIDKGEEYDARNY